MGAWARHAAPDLPDMQIFHNQVCPQERWLRRKIPLSFMHRCKSMPSLFFHDAKSVSRARPDLLGCAATKQYAPTPCATVSHCPSHPEILPDSHLLCWNQCIGERRQHFALHLNHGQGCLIGVAAAATTWLNGQEQDVGWISDHWVGVITMSQHPDTAIACDNTHPGTRSVRVWSVWSVSNDGKAASFLQRITVA